MNWTRTWLLINLAGLAGCAMAPRMGSYKFPLPEIEYYDGPTAKYVGQGGTYKTVNGVDIYTSGGSRRPVQLIGYISGCTGGQDISDDGITRVAKKAGSNILIRESARMVTLGSGDAGTINATATTIGNTTDVTARTHSDQDRMICEKYAVLKYVDQSATK